MKIEQNRDRDNMTRANLRAAGWRVAEVWECAMKGRIKLPEAEMLNRCEMWLRSESGCLVIEGQVA